MSFALQRKA